ncbi:MAG: D-glycero-beta-D-manno-heptose 1,7-bisphosphate 7-phosphatase [Fusobacterium sp.]|nr:D-glycero-beta-D-manno-heptose 1,7-bisphosphate 7-phosphatase [Fusobacterium sp.]
MKKAIFLDRDGTINVEKNYLYKIEELEFESGVVNALKTFKKLGYLLIVVSNQSGIGRGYYTEEDFYKFSEEMNKILKKDKVEIDEFYFCPHHPEKAKDKYKIECECRKPNNKLIEDAIKKYDIDRENSYMIGDKISDILAGEKSNLKTILVKTGHGRSELEEMNELEKEKINICENLGEVAEFLKRKKLNGLLKEKFSVDVEISSVAMNTDKVKKGTLFFAINNGNKYVDLALQKGASLVIADNSEVKDTRIIKVKDTVETMQELAKEYRKKLGLKIIGITGSNGKTSTKDIIFSILSQKYKCLKTEGNYNNHIGLPYTILSLTDEEDFGILEMGMSDFGEIKLLGEISQPDYAVITNIGDSHLEFLKNRENVFKAKTELLEFVEADKTFVCGDDEYLSRLDNTIKIGFDNKNNKIISSVEIEEKGSKFIYDDEKYQISLLGKHNVVNTALAIELAKSIEFSKKELEDGLKAIKITAMRFQEIKRDEDIYINDAYNASPTSMKAAIDTFNSIYNDRYKIAILGDMLELGENEINLHIDILNYLLDKNIKLIYLYGERMKKAHQKFMEDKNEEYRFWCYETKEQIIESLKNIRMKKVILLKGSRGMKLEEIIEK